MDEEDAEFFRARGVLKAGRKGKELERKEVESKGGEGSFEAVGITHPTLLANLVRTAPGKQQEKALFSRKRAGKRLA
eukprot:3646796-Rhodomonas_salina.1